MRRDKQQGGEREPDGGGPRSLFGRSAPQTAAPAPQPTAVTPEGRPCCYPPDAILTEADVAAVLAVSVRTVKRWPIRRAPLGHKTPRFLYRDVVKFVDGRAA